MKKKWMFCLSAVLLTFAACSDDEKGTDEQPGPIIGEWVFEKNEVYRNGKLAESFTAVETADKMIAIFREDGTYRYYDYPPKEYYNGTYTYEESTKNPFDAERRCRLFRRFRPAGLSRRGDDYPDDMDVSGR